MEPCSLEVKDGDYQLNALMQATMEKGLVEDKDIARSIKQEFDKNHGPTWHCIVGRHFGETTLQIK